MSADSSAGSTPTAGGGEPAGLNAAGSAVTSFDPDSVLPKDMDFVAWAPKEVSHKVEKREKKGDLSLAKRLMLDAFSTSVGWRPTGLNLGQARLFIERFPSEFRLGAMSKVVMPCCKGKAFVCPDGKLPCPFLSTCSALKVIEKKKDIAGDCDPRAWKDIQRVLEKGVQVEWVEFDDYMSYMIYCEGIAVQSDVVVKPHILDTALMFLGFCKSKRGRALQAQAAAGIDAAAAEVDPQNQHGEGANKLEEAFLECMTGKAKHRLKEAKVVLRSTEPEAVQFLAAWRKSAHFCHANALAQQWFLTGEWHGLRGVTLGPWCEEKSLTAQMAVAEIVTKMLGRCEIQSKGDTPKLARCSVNLDIFRETAGVITPGLQYFQRLQETHQAAWWKVGGAKNWHADCSLMGSRICEAYS